MEKALEMRLAQQARASPSKRQASTTHIQIEGMESYSRAFNTYSGKVDVTIAQARTLA